MSAIEPDASKPAGRIDRLRRQLVGLALLVTVLALLHHADHVIRGELVVENGLNPNWDHSGWPFKPEVTPFTASLAVYVILVPGILFTLRRRLWAGYWLGAAMVLGAVIFIVHFLPGPETETPNVIYNSHDSAASTAVGALALADVFAIVASLLALAVVAVAARRASGRW